MPGSDTTAGTRRPRLPLTLYATWQQPPVANLYQTFSLGAYGELGRDIFTVDEQLQTGSGGTLALAGRVGMERPRRRRDASTVGTYVRAAVGLSMASDPDRLAVSRYGRLGVERSWSWGREP